MVGEDRVPGIEVVEADDGPPQVLERRGLGGVAELALRATGTSWRRAASAAAARPGELVLICHKSARAEGKPAGALVVDLAAEIARRDAAGRNGG